MPCPMRQKALRRRARACRRVGRRSGARRRDGLFRRREIAALAASRWETPEARPAFQALIYPAIPKDMKFSKDTPPAFLACGEDDRQNISQGLPELYLAMKKAGPPPNSTSSARSGMASGCGTR